MRKFSFVLVFFLLFSQKNASGAKCPENDQTIETPKGCLESLGTSTQKGPNCWAYAYANMIDIYQRCTLQKKDTPKVNPWNFILDPKSNELEQKSCLEEDVAPCEKYKVNIAASKYICPLRQHHQGGSMLGAHKILEKNNGKYCDFEKTHARFIYHRSSLNKFFENIILGKDEFKLNRNKVLVAGLNVTCHFGSIGADTFIRSLYQFSRQYKQSKSASHLTNELFFKYLNDLCKNKKAVHNLSPIPSLKNVTSSTQEMQQEIANSLKKNTPLGITYCSEIFNKRWDLDLRRIRPKENIMKECRPTDNSQECGAHVSVIVGQSSFYNSRLKKWQCFYKVKNTWGAECGHYHRSYSQDRWDLCDEEWNGNIPDSYRKATSKFKKSCPSFSFCEEETGSVWVESELLLKNTSKLNKF